MFAKAWYDYASMCSAGRGGDIDLGEAYFYYSACSYLLHPDSVVGKDVWKKREEAGAKLGGAKALMLLRKLDSWFQEKGRPPNLIAGYVNPAETLEEGESQRKRMEAEHRRALQERPE
jgi:hypothetical protein